MNVEFENSTIVVKERCETLETCEKIAMESNLQCEIHEEEQNNFKYNVVWKGSDAIDYLNKKSEKLEYLQPMMPVGLTTKYKLLSDNAVVPTKAHASDSGWDLTVVDVHKQSGNVTFFTTNVSVEPPHGYYFDLVPRSSLSKTGYILANSVGIIDQSYRGPIIGALMKVDQSMPDLELPCKCLQLILRPWYHCSFVNESMTNTVRNDGGFGSTN